MNLVRTVTCRSMSTFSRHRQFLSRFSGGCVDLHKDDSTGIAEISLKHEGKRNALSGTIVYV